MNKYFHILITLILISGCSKTDLSKEGRTDFPDVGVYVDYQWAIEKSDYNIQKERLLLFLKEHDVGDGNWEDVVHFRYVRYAKYKLLQCYYHTGELEKADQLFEELMASDLTEPTQISEPHQTKQSYIKELHERIRNDQDPHDAFIEAGFYDEKSTIPVLLERFGREYGTSVPEPPPSGLIRGFVCTHVHLIDSLRRLTNTDQGMWYPKWASWWEANQKLSLRQWRLNGFTEAGLHVSDPIEEIFAFELIETMGKNSPEFLSVNARILLADVPEKTLSQWITMAANSEQRLLRLGAVRYIERILKGYDAVLRELKSDSDPEIRERTSSVLKDLEHTDK